MVHGFGNAEPALGFETSESVWGQNKILRLNSF